MCKIENAGFMIEKESKKTIKCEVLKIEGKNCCRK